MPSSPPLSPLMKRIAAEYSDATDSKLPMHLLNSPLGAIAYAAAQAGWARGNRWYKTRRTWTVTVDGSDELFFDAQLWLMEHGAEKTRKALSAQTYYGNHGGNPSRAEVRLIADDDEPQDMSVNGHIVTVTIVDPGSPAGGTNTSGSGSLKSPKLLFSARSQQGRDAVVQLLRELRKERVNEKRQPGLMVLDKWGDWRRRSDLPPRPMASVITKNNVQDELFRDLEEFIGQEDDYVRRAMPYHRAYLLIGQPGTGKTSAVKAISNALGLDLWYAQLSGIDKDTKLSDVFGEVRARGVLLLEDIDSLPAAIDRTAEGAGDGDISTSGLLNALDGVATPHGLVTILTTNHPEHLDPALMRPGRVDRIISFEYPDRLTMFRHFEFFYGQKPEHSGEWELGRSSAAVSEIFKQHMHAPEAADYALTQHVSDEEERDWHSGAAGFPGGKERAFSPSKGGVKDPF